MTTKLADDAATEAAKKAVAEDKKAAEKSAAEYVARTKGKPTPTQAENDIALSGGHILQHEDDGSAPDPHNKPVEDKALDAEKPHARPQTYSTRAQRAE